MAAPDLFYVGDSLLGGDDLLGGFPDSPTFGQPRVRDLVRRTKDESTRAVPARRFTAVKVTNT